MNNVLKSMRLHIGIFGRRNVGKSSLLNFLAGQDVAIVSDIAGTTTDVVEKVMELIPVGPVVFLDTAGIDDVGSLGNERIKKTLDAIDRIDIGFIVCDYNGISDFEKSLVNEFQKRNTPFAILINKNDVEKISDEKFAEIKNVTENVLSINTKDEIYKNLIKEIIIKIMPSDFFDEEKILDDVISAGDTVIQVIPIDKEAPKGRLILPQVRLIRNVLDIGAKSVVVGVDGLNNALSDLKTKPKLVITDSQAFCQVEKIVPDDIFLTSYSIIFARLKGDLKIFKKGVEKVSNLNDGEKILICESCSHHSTCDDIGRVKIPNLIKKITGKIVDFEFTSGHDFPSDLSKYSLIIHCGGCMTNKKEVLSRIIRAQEANIPITNYGITIAYCCGILDRATKVFDV